MGLVSEYGRDGKCNMSTRLAKLSTKKLAIIFGNISKLQYQLTGSHINKCDNMISKWKKYAFDFWATDEKNVHKFIYNISTVKKYSERRCVIKFLSAIHSVYKSINRVNKYLEILVQPVKKMKKYKLVLLKFNRAWILLFKHINFYEQFETHMVDIISLVNDICQHN